MYNIFFWDALEHITWKKIESVCEDFSFFSLTIRKLQRQYEQWHTSTMLYRQLFATVRRLEIKTDPSGKFRCSASAYNWRSTAPVVTADTWLDSTGVVLAKCWRSTGNQYPGFNLVGSFKAPDKKILIEKMLKKKLKKIKKRKYWKKNWKVYFEKKFEK